MAALAAGLVITALIAWWARGVHRGRGESDFRKDATRQIGDARAELRSAFAATESIAAFLHRDAAVEPSQFHALAERVIDSHPGLAGVGWARHIGPESIPTVEALIQKSSTTGMIWEPGPENTHLPVGRRDRYIPIVFFHPSSSHQAVIGIDLLHAAPPGSFVHEALTSGQPGVWGPFTMEWLPGSPAAIMTVAPVAPSPEDPSADSGAAFGVLLLDGMLASTATDSGDDISLRVASLQPFPRITTRAAAIDGGGSAEPARPAPPRLVHEEPLRIQGMAGSAIILRAEGDPGRYYAGESDLAWGLLGAGTLLSIILAGLVGARAAGASNSRRIVHHSRELTRVSSSLRESEERYRLAIQAIEGIAYDWDVASGRVTRSGGVIAVLGIAPGELEPSFDAWFGVIHPDDVERVRREVSDAVCLGHDFSLEYRIRQLNGGSIQVWDRGVLVRDAGGQVRRVVGCVVKALEGSRAGGVPPLEENQDFRELFDANQVPQVVFDAADGRIVQANAAAISFYGYTREQLAALTMLDLEPRRKRGGMPGDAPTRVESTHRVASGEVREVEVFSSQIPRGGRVLVHSLVFDITERKKIEAALHESRRTLEQAQAVGRIGSWVSDAAPDGRLRWSSQVFRIFGVAPETFEPQISTFFRLVHPDDLDAVRETVAGAIRDGSVYRIDHRIVRPDGEVRWVHEQGEVEYDPAGVPTRIIGVVQDITERKTAEQALRDSQERLRTILDSLAEGCIVLSTSGRVLECNPAAEAILGLSREDLVGSGAEARQFQVLGADGAMLSPDMYPAVATLRTGHPVDGALVGFRRPAGDVRWLSVNARSFRSASGEVVGVVTSFADITDRRAATDAIQQTARKYQVLFDANPEPVWVYDAQSLRFLAVNRAAIEAYGYSHDEFRAMTILDIRLPEDAERLRRHIETIGHAGRLRATWVHRVKDGRLIDVEVLSHPLDFEGRAARIVLAKDITARRQAEQALRATQLRLATILEHLPDVVVYEADRNSLFPSANILSLIGYSASLFAEDRAAFKTLVHPADRDNANARIERLWANRHTEALVIQYRLRHRDGHYLWVEDRMVFEHPAQGNDRLLGFLIDISDRKRSEQRQRLMMAELDHRVKNNLATVISLLEQTGRTARTKQEFQLTFLGRLQALARMHKALSRTHWEGVGLHALVSQTLEAYQSSPPGRVTVVGDDITLPARAASPVAMAIHELATNAAKYGALSVPQGKVRVEWTVQQDENGVRRIALLWTEADGPPVSESPTPGFGAELIQGGIAYELHGEARIEFKPQGVQCFMTIPLADTPSAEVPVVEPG